MNQNYFSLNQNFQKILDLKERIEKLSFDYDNSKSKEDVYKNDDLLKMKDDLKRLHTEYTKIVEQFTLGIFDQPVNSREILDLLNKICKPEELNNLRDIYLDDISRFYENKINIQEENFDKICEFQQKFSQQIKE